MRRDGIPYVQNPPKYYPPIDLSKLTLDEIKKKFIKTCGKANGDLAVCSKCTTPCNEGKRAIQLLANNVYDDPKVPLFAGKTMIECAKEENMRKRAEKEKAEAEKARAEQELKAEKKTKRKYIKLENWFEDSLASGDQVQWVCDNYGISKTQAKKKIYNYKLMHGMTGSNTETKTETRVENGPVVRIEEKKEEPRLMLEAKDENIEHKLESLLKQQEEQKKAMDEYMKLYEAAKSEYEKIKHKTDILCSALDILNDP